MARTFACLCMLAVLALPATAFAGLPGNTMVEYNYDWSWRGVAGDIKVWPSDLMSPNGKHVSSLYMYNYGTQIFVETRIVKEYGWTGHRAFWEWNKNPNFGPDEAGNKNWAKGNAASLGTGNWVYFEANNFEMTNPSDGYNQWRMAWNGQLISTVDMPMLAGVATASNERQNATESGPDESPASYNNMKKKNNSGSWSLWVDAREWMATNTFYFWHKDATNPNWSFWQSRP